ncbi:response regulator [Hamadaea flava]|uniref:Response regulator n=1 Tax=Hamadaea flava TaxID=1742688 RepID=A0ABV8LXM3_9ACTN|nr:response regulator transcription factor [Hamadaea flava]
MAGDGVAAVRVALVDDDELIRVGLAAIIGAAPDMTVVGTGADGADVPDLVARHRPDVLLIDVRMPLVDGISATERLLAVSARPPKIIVITTFENDDYVYAALRAGASGFLLKRSRPAEVLEAIRVAAAGESLVFPAALRAMIAGHARPKPLPAQLTEREAEILRLIASGLSNAEIAARLVVSVETVKTHVANLLAKLGARDRTQAVIAAYESGFVTPGG